MSEKFKCRNCGIQYPHEFACDDDVAICKWCCGAAYKTGADEDVCRHNKRKTVSGHILRAIRQAMGCDENDTSLDWKIEKMSPDEQFALYCQWNGFLGWSEKLSAVVLELWEVKL